MLGRFGVVATSCPAQPETVAQATSPAPHCRKAHRLALKERSGVTVECLGPPHFGSTSALLRIVPPSRWPANTCDRYPVCPESPSGTSAPSLDSRSRSGPSAWSRPRMRMPRAWPVRPRPELPGLRARADERGTPPQNQALTKALRQSNVPFGRPHVGPTVDWQDLPVILIVRPIGVSAHNKIFVC